MGMNRRNALIGMGTIAAGGGALFATGAFSTVEADRTVNVETAGDSGALVGLDITSDTLSGSGETIEFNLTNDLNLDAVTRFNESFEITNNRANSSDTVNIEITDGSTSLTTTDVSTAGTGMYFEHASGELTDIAGSGGSVTIDVVFDLQGITTTTAGNDEIPGEITVTATDSSS